MVTGPSFNKLTCILAPNIPFSTFLTYFLHSFIKYSYNSFAILGSSAFTKLGLFPYLQSAYNVN